MVESELLRLTASAESRSEHPLAKAIVADARTRGISLTEPDHFEAVTGQGVRAVVDGSQIMLGSPNFMRQMEPLPDAAESQLRTLAEAGKTVMLVKHNDDWAGMVALADQLRPEAVETVRWLKAQGIEVAMLTGDNARVAQAIAGEVGIDRFFADLLPEEKVDAIRQLQADVGPIAMVGDGVNDAPALAVADVGIAMGAAGTDVALETADLVLMGDRLELIERALDLSKKARRVVWQNIAFSLAVIVMLIAGVFLIDLPLPLGVLGHEGSTVLVVLNGLIQLLLWPGISRQGRKDTPQMPVTTQ
jgi:Cd2+/Zn2+-exporting ATPase